MLRPGTDPRERAAADPPEDLVGEVIAAFQPYDPKLIPRERGEAMTRNLGDALTMLRGWRLDDEAAAAAACPAPPPAEPPPAPPAPPVRRPKRRKFPAEIP